MELIPIEQVGVEIFHHFSPGRYTKETRIPAGEILLQHKHKLSHDSVLIKGVAIVTVDGVSMQYMAPHALTIPAGKVHAVMAVTDVVWYCLFETDETDPGKIDHEVVA